jgi:hypothetical protein
MVAAMMATLSPTQSEHADHADNAEASREREGKRKDRGHL